MTSFDFSPHLGLPASTVPSRCRRTESAQDSRDPPQHFRTIAFKISYLQPARSCRHERCPSRLNRPTEDHQSRPPLDSSSTDSQPITDWSIPQLSCKPHAFHTQHLCALRLGFRTRAALHIPGISGYELASPPLSILVVRWQLNNRDRA